MNKQLEINPQTKIGEMLDTYPELEDVLLKLSPSFAKLKNPILRKTVGRIASLRQVAEIGGMDVGVIVSILRKEIGQTDENHASGFTNSDEQSRPIWAEDSKISITFDASSMIESGQSPMTTILGKAEQLNASEIMLLIAPFKPIPIIELLVSKGYIHWCKINDEGKVYTYLSK